SESRQGSDGARRAAGGIVAGGAGGVSAVQKWEPMSASLEIPRRAIPLLAAGVFGLILLGAIRAIALLGSLAGLRRLRRCSTPLPPRFAGAIGEVVRKYGCRGVVVRASSEAATPATLGFTAPVILFPIAMLDELSEADWRHIALHEIAHVRRYDDWSTLAQRLLERLFTVLPGVAWAGRRLDLEREKACDEFAAQLTGKPREYAAALLKVAEAAVRPAPALAPSATARTRRLGDRIESLLVERDVSLRGHRLRVTTATSLVLASAAFLIVAPGIGIGGAAQALPTSLSAIAAAPPPGSAAGRAVSSERPRPAALPRGVTSASNVSGDDTGSDATAEGGERIAGDSKPGDTPRPSLALTCVGCPGSPPRLQRIEIDRPAATADRGTIRRPEVSSRDSYEARSPALQLTIRYGPGLRLTPGAPARIARSIRGQLDWNGGSGRLQVSGTSGWRTGSLSIPR
ncbi:MAG: M56 family metallopeptidase, partial [Gemmatimonadota bacterium]